MIRMTYRCPCGWSSGVLNSAQEHANTTRHVVDITGEISPSADSVMVSNVLSPALARKVYEDTVLRLAKQKGLVGKKP